jgi:hypothetical protein
VLGPKFDFFLLSSFFFNKAFCETHVRDADLYPV